MIQAMLINGWLFVALALAAPTHTLTVGSTGAAFRTIGAALIAARPGDTILVSPGLYREKLVIDKPLVLRGIDHPTIRGDGKGSVITITADRCTVRGFRIEQSGLRLEDNDAGILVKSDGNTIADNELRHILFGIYLSAANDNTIVGNRIEGRSELDIGRRGNGIHLWNCTGNTFADNVIVRVRDGIYFDHADHNVVRRNRIERSRYGLHYMYSNVSLFEENLLYGNYAGAALMYSDELTFRRNVFFRNRVGYSALGVLFKDCDRSLAEQNVIADNGVGLFLDNSMHNLFRRNLIIGNDAAIQLFSSALDNTFTENVFIDNLSPLRLVGRRTTTHWSHHRRGNYWDGYTGYDLDGDGIGDLPFRIQNIFQYLEGRHARLRLYLYSPAAQALARAEALFPVIEGSHERDPFPLMRPPPLDIPERIWPGRFQRRSPSPPSAFLSLALFGVSLTILWREQRR